jgi:hypothetical protein
VTNEIIIEIYKQNEYTSKIASLQQSKLPYVEFRNKVGYIVQDLANKDPRFMRTPRDEFNIDYISYIFYKRRVL